MEETLIEEIKVLTQTLVSQFELAIENENLGLVQKPLFYLSLLEEMFGIEQVFERKADRRRFIGLSEEQQLEYILGFLGEKVLGQEIGNIDGREIVEGNLGHIQQLLQIFGFLGQEVARGGHPEAIPEEDSRFENFNTGNTRSEIAREPLIKDLGELSEQGKENRDESNRNEGSKSKSKQKGQLKVSERVDANKILGKGPLGQSESDLTEGQNGSEDQGSDSRNLDADERQSSDSANKGRLGTSGSRREGEVNHISKIEQDIQEYFTSKESENQDSSVLHRERYHQQESEPNPTRQRKRKRPLNDFQQSSRREQHPNSGGSGSRGAEKPSDHSLEQMGYGQLVPKYQVNNGSAEERSRHNKSLFGRFNSQSKRGQESWRNESGYESVEGDQHGEGFSPRQMRGMDIMPGDSGL